MSECADDRHEALTSLLKTLKLHLKTLSFRPKSGAKATASGGTCFLTQRSRTSSRPPRGTFLSPPPYII